MVLFTSVAHQKGINGTNSYKECTRKRETTNPLACILIHWNNYRKTTFATLFNNKLDPFLSAYRCGFWPSVSFVSYSKRLGKCLRQWKMFGAARLMDLSKAFEYLPHDLLFLNIENYALNQFFICLCIRYFCWRYIKVYHKGLSICASTIFNVFK